MRQLSTRPSAWPRMAVPAGLPQKPFRALWRRSGQVLTILAVMIEGKRGTSAPMIGFAQAGNDGFFDDAGFPLGDGWDDVRFPGMGTDTVYALEIADDSMEPVYRAGDRIIVSPEAPIRRGDRVVAKTVHGEVVAKVLGRCTETRVELLSFNLSYAPRKFAPDQIAWMARILWASP